MDVLNKFKQAIQGMKMDFGDKVTSGVERSPNKIDDKILQAGKDLSNQVSQGFQNFTQSRQDSLASRLADPQRRRDAIVGPNTPTFEPAERLGTRLESIGRDIAEGFEGISGPQTQLVGGPGGQFLGSIGGRVVEEFGRAGRRTASPEGREEIVSGAERFPSQFGSFVRDPSVERGVGLLENPFVETAFVGADVGDIARIGATSGLAAGLAKNLFDNKKTLKFASRIDEIVPAIRNYDTLTPEMQMGLIRNADEVAQEVIPDVVKSKKMKKLATLNPKRWLNTVGAFLEDARVSAEEVAPKVGLSTDPLRRGTQPPLSDTKNVAQGGLGDTVGTGTRSFVGEPLEEAPDAIKRTAQQNYQEWQRGLKQRYNLQTENQLIDRMTRQMGRETGSEIKNLVPEMEDISNYAKGMKDLERNLETVFGDNFKTARRVILDPLDDAKTEFWNMQKRYLDDLEENVVKKYGIKQGSEESAAVQLYGEGQLTEAELVEQFGKEKARDIVKADAWFRNKYDELLKKINKARARIYPNNPEKQIPRREDYYRHFKELNQGLSGLTNIFETPANIDSKLAGISEFTQPRTKWQSFAQRRLGIGEPEVDAVGGFLNYLPAAAHATHIDDQVSNVRLVARELENATTEGTQNVGKVNNFIEYLHDLANDMAGKTNPVDRAVQKYIPGGRKAFRAINWLNSRVKANVILGNLSSTVAQIFNVPQGIADAGPVNSAKGLRRTLAGIFTDTPISKSQFVNNRYAQRTYSRFSTGMLDKTKDFASWVTGALDEVGTRFIWHAEYERALAEGIENPIRFADRQTRKMVAGRDIGEVPLVQSSKIGQVIAPFQIEVQNLWHVLGDFVSEKQFGKLVTFALASYMFNRVGEQIRGHDVSFDPINALVDGLQAYGEEDDKKVGALRLGGRLAGEGLSNFYMGQTLAAVYPEYGIEVPGTDETLTREEFFGDADPTRFGTGLAGVLTGGAQDPLFKLAPPFGGSQIKKTLGGAQALAKGFSETPSGRVRYPVEATPGNVVRNILFGEYSTPQAREYFESDSGPLGENQSEKFKLLPEGSRRDFFENVMGQRQASRDERELREALAKGEVKPSEMESASSGLLVLYDLDKYTEEPPSSAGAKARWEKERVKNATDLLNDEDIPSELKTEAFRQVGLDRDTVEYYDLASQEVRIRTLTIEEQLDRFDPKERESMYELLANMRKEVAGKMVLSNGVINDLVEDGYITDSEGDVLKDLKFDEDGNIKVKVSGRGGGAKLKNIKFVPLDVAGESSPASRILTQGSLPSTDEFNIQNIRFNTPDLSVNVPEQGKIPIRFNI